MLKSWKKSGYTLWTVYFQVYQILCVHNIFRWWKKYLKCQDLLSLAGRIMSEMCSFIMLSCIVLNLTFLQ